MRQRVPPGHLPLKQQAALLRGKVGAARSSDLDLTVKNERAAVSAALPPVATTGVQGNWACERSHSLKRQHLAIVPRGRFWPGFIAWPFPYRISFTKKKGPPMGRGSPEKIVLFDRISLGTLTSRCTPRVYIGLQFRLPLHAPAPRRRFHC